MSAWAHVLLYDQNMMVSEPQHHHHRSCSSSEVALSFHDCHRLQCIDNGTVPLALSDRLISQTALATVLLQHVVARQSLFFR